MYNVFKIIVLFKLSRACLLYTSADAFEKIAQAGYKIKFALLPDVSIGTWDDFKSKFGY